MKRRLDFSFGQIAPRPRAVLKSQGVPNGVNPSPRIADLCAQALQLLDQLARPAGLLARVTVDEFAEIYTGRGENRGNSSNRYTRSQELPGLSFTGSCG